MKLEPRVRRQVKFFGEESSSEEDETQTSDDSGYKAAIAASIQSFKKKKTPTGNASKNKKHQAARKETANGKAAARPTAKSKRGPAAKKKQTFATDDDLREAMVSLAAESNVKPNDSIDCLRCGHSMVWKSRAMHFATGRCRESRRPPTNDGPADADAAPDPPAAAATPPKDKPSPGSPPGTPPTEPREVVPRDDDPSAKPFFKQGGCDEDILKAHEAFAAQQGVVLNHKSTVTCLRCDRQFIWGNRVMHMSRAACRNGCAKKLDASDPPVVEKPTATEETTVAEEASSPVQSAESLIAACVAAHCADGKPAPMWNTRLVCVRCGSSFSWKHRNSHVRGRPCLTAEPVKKDDDKTNAPPPAAKEVKEPQGIDPAPPTPVASNEAESLPTKRQRGEPVEAAKPSSKPAAATAGSKKKAKSAGKKEPAPAPHVVRYSARYPHIGVPFLLSNKTCGVFFTDGSCCMVDPDTSVHYRNKKGHRFSLRSFTGRLTIPRRLKAKIQGALWTRSVLARGKEPMMAIGASSTRLAETSVTPPPNATGRESGSDSQLPDSPVEIRDGLATNVGPERQQHDNPVFFIVTAEDDPTAVVPPTEDGNDEDAPPRAVLRFAVSSDAATYPGAVYYPSDEDEPA